MGAMKGKKHEDGDRRRRRRKPPTQQVKWSSLNGNIILNIIAAVDETEGAIRFGRNRAGDSFAIGFYGDGDSFTEYFTGLEGADEWLAEILSDYSE